MHAKAFVVLCLCACSLCRQQGIAQTGQELLATPLNDFGLFGHGAGIDDGLIVVGEPHNELFGPQTGRVYVFERGGSGVWEQRESFGAIPDSVQDSFGWRVKGSAGRFAISLPGFEEFRSDIWIFRNDPVKGLVFEDALNDETPTQQFAIGTRFDFHGERLAASSFHDPNNDVVGSATIHIFEKGAGTEWSETAQVHSPAPQEFDIFGASVAVLDSWLFVGAVLDSEALHEAGAVYVFRLTERGVWVIHDVLTAPDPEFGMRFGSGLAADGDLLVAGAEAKDDGAENTGAVYVYRRGVDDHWSFESKLIPSFVGENDFLGGTTGETLAIDGNRAVIGAPFSDLRSPNAGAAFVFERDEQGVWSEIAALTSAVVGDGAELGWTVDIEGDTVVAGALFAHLNEGQPGAAVVFNLAACLADLNGDGVVNGADLSSLLATWSATDAPADLNGDGIVNGADLAMLLASWGSC